MLPSLLVSKLELRSCDIRLLLRELRYQVTSLSEIDSA